MLEKHQEVFWHLGIWMKRMIGSIGKLCGKCWAVGWSGEVKMSTLGRGLGMREQNGHE